MTAAEHDNLTVALSEVDRHAFALGVYAAIIRDYAAIGDVDGIERGIRSAITQVRLMAGEYKNLPCSESERAA